MTRDELLALVADRYQTTPEYLWERWPGYAVLRNTSNQKWYGVVMDVPAGRLGLEDAAPDERVDILNVKVDPDDALVLRLSGHPSRVSHEQAELGLGAPGAGAKRAGRGADRDEQAAHCLVMRSGAIGAARIGCPVDIPPIRLGGSLVAGVPGS